MTEPDRSMKGRVCMVTGATSSIGEVTARELAKMGATVIVVGRNPEKSAATVDMIKQYSGNLNVEFMLADLSSQKEIRCLAEEFRSRYKNLHVLVNNAGAVFTTRQESADGIEMTFALNHLGYFLLTDLLLDVLKASAPGRIINISTDVLEHNATRINFDDLQCVRSYGFWKRYLETKYANLLFSFELAKRLGGTGVTSNAVCPGVLASNLGLNNKGFLILMWRVIKPAAHLFMTSPERGARTIIHLASSPEVEGVTGEYFEKGSAVESFKALYDEESSRRLWRRSAELTRLKP